MSAKDAHCATANAAMRAASQRDRLLVEVLRGEKLLSDELIYAKVMALAHNNLALMPGTWETIIEALGQLFELRRIAHEITTSNGMAETNALPQEEA